jgi:hypothetical protein
VSTGWQRRPPAALHSQGYFFFFAFFAFFFAGMSLSPPSRT